MAMARLSRPTDPPMFFPPRNWSRRFGTQFYTIEIKEVIVKTDESTSEKIALYSIIVKRGKQERIINRRYSEFYEYHRSLVRFSSYARRCTFPPKTWFRKLSEEFLAERRGLLDTYLQQVLHDQRIARHKYTVAFLNLNNFELYRWWDFMSAGFSEREIDKDFSLREKSLSHFNNSKRKTANKQTHRRVETEDSESIPNFKERANSLYTDRDGQSSPKPSLTGDLAEDLESINSAILDEASTLEPKKPTAVLQKGSFENIHGKEKLLSL